MPPQEHTADRDVLSDNRDGYDRLRTQVMTRPDDKPFQEQENDEHIPAKHEIFYSKLSSSEETEINLLFNKRNVGQWPFFRLQ